MTMFQAPGCKTNMMLAAGLAVGLLAMSSAMAANYDGVYVGDIAGGTAKTARSRCIEAFPNTRLTVKDNVASMRWNGPLTGPVGPDGSLSLQGSNGISVVGSLAGGVFNGTINGTYCTFSAILKKS